MSKKMMIVCDNCGVTLENGDGNKLRITSNDPSQPSREGDLCDNCVTVQYGDLPTVTRPGRKPGRKATTTRARTSTTTKRTTARKTTRRRRKRATARA